MNTRSRLAAFLFAVAVSFLAGFASGGWVFFPRHVSTRPTGVATQTTSGWRVSSADFRQLSGGTELEQVESALGPPSATWWEEKTVLVALWVNPDSSTLTLGFEPNDSGRFVMATKSEVDLPAALPNQ